MIGKLEQDEKTHHINYPCYTTIDSWLRCLEIFGTFCKSAK